MPYQFTNGDYSDRSFNSLHLGFSLYPGCDEESANRQWEGDGLELEAYIEKGSRVGRIFRGQRTELRNIVVANWHSISAGELSRRDVKDLIAGNPAIFLIIAQIIIPILIALIERWLENRDT